MLHTHCRPSLRPQARVGVAVLPESRRDPHFLTGGADTVYSTRVV